MYLLAVSWAVLGVGLPLIALGALAVWRRPVLAVYAFAVGLAFHNAVFLGLWLAGAHGWQLTLLQAWKELLLATALLSVAWRAWRERRLPFERRPLDLAIALFALVALAYFVLPGSALAGSPGARARFYGLRELVLPVAAYAVGRSLALRRDDWRRIAAAVVGVSVAVAGIGLIEDYAIPLSVWRHAGAARYFRDQLHFPVFHGPAGLPENIALNTSSGVFRRLASTYLSPLGTAYQLVVALLVAAAWRGRRRVVVAVASAVMLAALALALSRAAAIALVAALVLLALVERRLLPAAGAVLAAGVTLGVAAAFTHVAPRTHFFPEDLAYQQANAKRHGGLSNGSPLTTSGTFSDTSSREHWAELRRSFHNFTRHPGGYGLGSGGQIAQRFGGDVAAGESLYLTVAVETGVAGLAALLVLVAATLWELGRAALRFRPAGVLLCAQAAVFAIAVQTEIWGVPWLVYVLWTLTGAAVTAARALEPA
jgi:O-antigen ligase/polysaccharide polymerase Wzy-like membrane protein